MRWEISEQEKLVTIQVHGALVSSEGREFRDEVLGKVVSGKDFVFQMEELEHIDTWGIGVLVQVQRKVESKGGQMWIAGLPEGPKILFEITNAHHVFHFVPTGGSVSH